MEMHVLTLAVAMTDMTVVVVIVYDHTYTNAMHIIIMPRILSGRIHIVKVVTDTTAMSRT